MIIWMTLQMSGGRYDDQQWPPVGIDFEVPDEEGEALVRDHNAIFVRASAPVSRAPASAAPVPISEPAATAAGPVAPKPEPVITEDEHDRLEAVADGTEEPQALEPKPYDPKTAWVDYATAQGASRSDAENMSKAQLMQVYGGRL